MVAILTLLIVLTISILITRIATVMLTHTGLSKETSRFQARSAFTGVGFTTKESERVVSHPLRRKILMSLMLLGNAGIVTAVATLILTFMKNGSGSITVRIVFLILGLMGLLALASSRWVDRHLSSLIDRALTHYTNFEFRDVASLLHLSGEYRISEMQVQPEDWIANKKLEDLELREEGIMVLGIEREDGMYLGTPQKSTEIYPHDTIILYGRASSLESLDKRRDDIQGYIQHRAGMLEQEQISEEEAERDAEAAATKET